MIRDKVKNVNKLLAHRIRCVINISSGWVKSFPLCKTSYPIHSVDGDLYFTIIQSLGFDAAGNPHAGRRQRIGRDVGRVHWQRIYDLIERLWPEYQRHALEGVYRENVNRILAAYGISWDLGEDGVLHRVLPRPAQEQVRAVIEELRSPRFVPAVELFTTAANAYDARPQRGRDACSNIFDAMESVAKEIYELPNSTFGQVINHIRRTQALNSQIIETLNAVNNLRNGNFGHGMTDPFGLNPAEVDFTYLTCIGAILLFTRTP